MAAIHTLTPKQGNTHLHTHSPSTQHCTLDWATAWFQTYRLIESMVWHCLHAVQQSTSILRNTNEKALSENWFILLNYLYSQNKLQEQICVKLVIFRLCCQVKLHFRWGLSQSRTKQNVKKCCRNSLTYAWTRLLDKIIFAVLIHGLLVPHKVSCANRQFGK